MAADAGLLIGDPAFEADHAALGLQKIDLGEEWTAMTGLPFIYAAWTGRPGAVDRGRRAGAAGGAARRASPPSMRLRPNTGAATRVRTARAAAYLRDNVRYGLGAEEAAGLQLFLDYAADLGPGARARRPLEFF